MLVLPSDDDSFYPSFTIKVHLVRQITFAGSLFNVIARYAGEYCGQKKDIYAFGDGRYERLKANKMLWEYATD
jgi:hypothetical protein